MWSTSSTVPTRGTVEVRGLMKKDPNAKLAKKLSLRRIEVVVVLFSLSPLCSAVSLSSL
jgi:hypothetical protein